MKIKVTDVLAIICLTSSFLQIIIIGDYIAKK